MWENIIVIAVLAAILGAAIVYIVKAKKSGKKCIGCPDADTCAARKNGCGCGCKIDEEK